VRREEVSSLARDLTESIFFSFGFFGYRTCGQNDRFKPPPLLFKQCRSLRHENNNQYLFCSRVKPRVWEPTFDRSGFFGYRTCKHNGRFKPPPLLFKQCRSLRHENNNQYLFCSRVKPRVLGTDFRQKRLFRVPNMRTEWPNDRFKPPPLLFKRCQLATTRSCFVLE
jgi:hypothetical protein